jgi:hypothetical protein
VIPVYQDLDDNCFQACVASMFEEPLSKVPHFCSDNRPAVDALPLLRDWCAPRGVFPITIPMQGLPLSVVLENLNVLVEGAHYILSGWAICNEQHAVICCDGKVVHDPAGRPDQLARAMGGRLHTLADELPPGGNWLATYFGSSALAYGKAAT